MATIKYEIEDYNAWQRGTQVSLILDPESYADSGEIRVYTFASIGNSGTPGAVYHGKHRTIASYYQQVSAKHLQSWLEEKAEEVLCRIAAAYRDSEWDGHNHVGKWANDEAIEQLVVKLDGDIGWAIGCGSISSYWDAGDFYGETKSEVVDCVLKWGSIEEAARQEQAIAEINGYLLEAGDIEDTFRQILEEAIEGCDSDSGSSYGINRIDLDDKQRAKAEEILEH